MSSIRVTFPTDDAAVRALEAAGFSVGRLQASSPRGVMFGEFDVQKWRNLRPGDKESLDGYLCRHGPAGSPASVTIHSADHIPAKAINKVADAARAAQSSQPPKGNPMTHRQKSYAKVGDIARAEPAFQEGEQHDARRFGDLTEECRDAETVLRNWIEIARFNIGTSALLAIMDRAREEQSN